MRFAHISDLHLCSRRSVDTVAHENPFAIAGAIAQDLDRISGVLDFIVVSGDLTEDADPASFRQFEELFGPLTPPVFTIPGNHDGPSGYFREARGGLISKSDVSGRVADLGGVRILGLNTCIENEMTGTLSGQDLDLVARELAAESAYPLIIVMHHPPFALGLRDFDDIVQLKGASGLEALLRSAATPPIILCGHVHRAYQARWRGAACFVAGSATLPFTSEQPFGDSQVHPADEARFYFVHSVDADGSHVVTPQPIRGGGSAS